MSNYAKNTSVSIDRSMSQIRILLSKEGADGVAIAEAGDMAAVQFVFEGKNYKFKINYPSRQDTLILFTNSGKERTDTQVETEIEKEKRRLWRAMCLYIKAAIEAHNNGIIDLKRSLMGNIMLPSGETIYEKLEGNMDQVIIDPKFLLG